MVELHKQLTASWQEERDRAQWLAQLVNWSGQLKNIIQKALVNPVNESEPESVCSLATWTNKVLFILSL